MHVSTIIYKNDCLYQSCLCVFLLFMWIYSCINIDMHLYLCVCMWFYISASTFELILYFNAVISARTMNKKWCSQLEDYNCSELQLPAIINMNRLEIDPNLNCNHFYFTCLLALEHPQRMSVNKTII